MNLNIAFNTIIYIMVFLFPGILFRKLYFSGNFKNQFEHGNVLERLLWNILASVMCIFLFASLVYYLTVVYDYKLFDSLEYEDIYNLFNELSKNTFPEKLKNLDGLILFGFVFLILYLFSAVIGYSCYFIVTKFRLDKKYSFLRFNNPWEYLTSVNSKTFKNIKLFRNYATYIDVLVGDKENKHLYKGRIHEIIYDKDYKIEHISLKNTIKFDSIILSPNCEKFSDEKGTYINGRFIDKNSIHLERSDKIVFKKFIDGQIFVIPNSNIQNLNFTYVEISDNLKKLNKAFYILAIIVGVLACIFLFINLFFNLIFSIYLDTVFKKILFTFSSFSLIIFTVNLITESSSQANHKNQTKVDETKVDETKVDETRSKHFMTYIIFLVCLPYTYLFQLITGLQFFLLFVIISLVDNIKLHVSKKIYVSILAVAVYFLILYCFS